MAKWICLWKVCKIKPHSSKKLHIHMKSQAGRHSDKQTLAVAKPSPPWAAGHGVSLQTHVSRATDWGKWGKTLGSRVRLNSEQEIWPLPSLDTISEACEKISHEQLFPACSQQHGNASCCARVWSCAEEGRNFTGNFRDKNSQMGFEKFVFFFFLWERNEAKFEADLGFNFLPPIYYFKIHAVDEGWFQVVFKPM